MNFEEEIILGVPYEVLPEELQDLRGPGAFPSIMGGEPVGTLQTLLNQFAYCCSDMDDS